jgi:hypothetical protein
MRENFEVVLMTFPYDHIGRLGDSTPKMEKEPGNGTIVIIGYTYLIVLIRALPSCAWSWSVELAARVRESDPRSP